MPIIDCDDKMIVDESSIGDKSTNDYDSEWIKTPRNAFNEDIPSTNQSAFKFFVNA
jgi:hypothetical protein